ncbi:MAG: hypothetical protein QOI47_171 [Actinomycetota bacterium]|nr:hypothetical protein [Actinomycetota bacterium]
MITTGARLWFAVTAFALAAGVVYDVATGGEHGGAVTFLFIAAAAAVIGSAAVVTRDGDAAAAGEGVREAVVVRSALPAPWPAVGALGAGVAVVGLAFGGLLLYVGFGIIGIAFAEWMVQGWAERSTGDHAYNRALRNRIMFPLEVPVIGLAGLALVIITLSRVLLAVPKNGSIVIAGAMAVLIMVGGSLVATRPKLSSGAISWLLAIAAVVLLAAGITSGVHGERKTEEHKVQETAK